MITIEQLLESVDLDFEPRFVTKDKIGQVKLWNMKPYQSSKWAIWSLESTLVSCEFESFGNLKLSEFEGKDWTECIYEVPRKTTGKIEKLTGVLSTNGKRKIMFPSDVSQEDIISKLHEVIDAVNELKENKGV